MRPYPRPNQAITLAFNHEVSRTYDEWDALTSRIRTGQVTPVDAMTHTRATTVAHTTLPNTPRPLPFRTLASLVDVTAGDDQQLHRIQRELTPDDPISELSQAQPRLDRAHAWVAGYLEPQDRTQPRVEPDTALLSRLDAWFTLLYQLLVGSDTGPRLPSLLLALGIDRVRKLLTLPA